MAGVTSTSNKSSSEVIEKLSRQPIQIKIAILVGILAVLSGVYWYFFYSDLVTDRDSAVAEVKKRVDEERALNKRKSEYQELLKKKADAEARLKNNSIKLPESSELPAFFQHLETQAATANVRLVSRNLDKEMPVENYIKVPVKLEVQGDFYQLNNYFKLLNETSRIITIENLSIGEPKRDGERTILTARFTASTFRQADRPAQPAPPPTPAPTPAAPAGSSAKSGPSPQAPTASSTPGAPSPASGSK